MIGAAAALAKMFDEWSSALCENLKFLSYQFTSIIGPFDPVAGGILL